jgi:hypothetical protein
MNPGPILLGLYSAIELVCSFVEISNYGFYLCDPLAIVFDSWLLQAIDKAFIRAAMSWCQGRRLVEDRPDTKLRLTSH